jgi:hypothetical protein
VPTTVSRVTTRRGNPGRQRDHPPPARRLGGHSPGRAERGDPHPAQRQHAGGPGPRGRAGGDELHDTGQARSRRRRTSGPRDGAGHQRATPALMKQRRRPCSSSKGSRHPNAVHGRRQRLLEPRVIETGSSSGADRASRCRPGPRSLAALLARHWWSGPRTRHRARAPGEGRHPRGETRGDRLPAHDRARWAASAASGGVVG